MAAGGTLAIRRWNRTGRVARSGALSLRSLSDHMDSPSSLAFSPQRVREGKSMAKQNEWLEPRIVVNGNELSFAQSLSVRVAVSHYVAWCQEQESKATLPRYADRLNEVLGFMAQGPGIPAPDL
jgi:hypothetical protein